MMELEGKVDVGGAEFRFPPFSKEMFIMKPYGDCLRKIGIVFCLLMEASE